MIDWGDILNWLGAAALALITWAFKSIAALTTRVSVLETRADASTSTLQRIEQKLDRLIERENERHNP